MLKQLAIFLCLMLGCAYSFAEDLSDPVDRQEVLQKLLEQKDSMQSLLSDIDKQYGETAGVLKKLQGKIEQKRDSLDNIRRNIDYSQSEVEKLSHELVKHIRLAYALGKTDTIRLLLNQQEPAISGRVMVYFNYFNKERLRKIADLELAVQHLDELDKQKQAETTLLEQDLENKKLEQVVLINAKKQRNELLLQMGADFLSSEQQLQQLQDSESSLKLLMSSLPALSDEVNVHAEQNQVLPSDDSLVPAEFLTLKGKLPWPVTGKLANKFGSARTEVTWDGVLIDAAEGVDVKAVTQGKVVFSEWFRSYGLMMIIDHGQGYLTLYGFNQSLYKQVGEFVAAGEVIASVGQSGGRSKTGLYFGIRNKGVPVDPLEWCRR
jgi:septal ring factor EnvC (AmiA/AmiB activator)